MTGSSRIARPAPRRPKPSSAKGGRPSSLVARAFARPGVTVAGAAFAALMTGIVANAIVFQKGRHPAPLFAPSHPATAPAKLPPARSESLPPPPPSVAAPAPVESVPPPPAAKVVPAPAKPAALPLTKTKPLALHPRPDAIKDLIGTLGGKPPAKPTGAHPVPKARPPAVTPHPVVEVGAGSPHN